MGNYHIISEFSSCRRRRLRPSVPGMPVDWGGESPPANLMEVKASKAQGLSREGGSEESAEQSYVVTYRNWI